MFVSLLEKINPENCTILGKFDSKDNLKNFLMNDGNFESEKDISEINNVINALNFDKNIVYVSNLNDDTIYDYEDALNLELDSLDSDMLCNYKIDNYSSNELSEDDVLKIIELKKDKFLKELKSSCRVVENNSVVIKDEKEINNNCIQVLPISSNGYYWNGNNIILY